MNQRQAFLREVEASIDSLAADDGLMELTNSWLQRAIGHRYAHNFEWLGRPIIQVPQDAYAMQELIWRVRPDLVIETGIAHGGSLVLSASMLALLDYCDAVQAGQTLDPRAPGRTVLGIDIDIRSHNRQAIEAHPMAHKIRMIEGSSVADEVVRQVHDIAAGYPRVMVALDSNHTHAHVLAELEAYAPLTSPGSYCIVWDTGIELLPPGSCDDRPWDIGNNPMTAVFEYLERLRTEGRMAADGADLRFEIDSRIENKIVITAGPSGFLRRL